MNKKELTKNKLDLEYHKESSEANVFLTLLTIGLLAFLGGFIFFKESSSFILGLIITFMAFTFGLRLYLKKSKRMEAILFEIENL